MAVAAKQLQTIHQELIRAFSEDDRISVVPLDGNPPDKYEVTYLLDGLQKNDSGEVESIASHTITLSIPFGYPHFPPSCKPRSPIFHPDFDPAAICIGDFWEKNRSIIELIKHIGEMITGRFYSTSNAFNEEAALWYQQNKAKIPANVASDSGSGDDDLLGDTAFPTPLGDDISSLLDDEVDESFSLDDDLSAGFGDSDPEPALSFADAPADKTDRVSDESSDISFEEGVFDFGPADDSVPAADVLAPPEFNSELSLEDKEAEETDEEDSVDVVYLLRLADQKRFFGLEKELERIPAEVDFAERDSLTRRVSETLVRVKQLYKKALGLEHKGSAAEALKLFKQVESETPDYPGLNDDIDRTTQAIELLGDWTEPTRKKKRTDDSFVGEPVGKKATDTHPGQKKRQKKEQGEARTFFDDGSQQASRIIPYAIGIIVLLVAAAAGFNYWLSTAKLKEASQLSAECQKALEANQFTTAEQRCEAALGAARQVRFFRSAKRDALISQIDQALSSEPLRQGLAGNLPLDGQYHPKEVLKTIQNFGQFKQAGDDYFAAADWQQSVSNYRQALSIGSNEKAVDQTAMLEIANNIKIAEFNILYQSGISFIDRKEWILATKDLSIALEQLKGLSIADKDQKIDAITARLGEIAQATEKEKGDISFAEGHWNEAAGHYKNGLSEAEKSAKPDERVIHEFKQLILKTNLYATVSSGKDAFRQAQWDTAISHYEQAIKILESNQEILRQANTEENRQKLARIMLQASIIRDKQDAARYLKEKQYADAVGTLQTILDSISASTFKSEPEFVAVYEEATRDIKKAELDRGLAEKIGYLEDNFEELFTRHYSGSPPESLVDRIVVFEKEVDGKLIFRLQCVEVGHGRPLQLIMKYANDPASGTWSFYSDSK